MTTTMTMTRTDGGFTVIELLISMSIMLTVTGAIFGLVNPGQGAFRVQPEVSDMQQRLRVATSLLHRDLMMAGAGTYTTTPAGPLSRFFAPVVPYRMGKVDADLDRGVFFREDAISVVFVPNTAAQTTILDSVSTPTARVRVNIQPGCPTADVVCGFEAGDTVLVFDDTGASDTFHLAGTQGNSVQLEVRGSAISKTYPVGSIITRVITHTYYLDTAAAQLMHYDGWETDTPLVDDVVGLNFRYFGDPNPPTSPRPPVGSGNCLFDASGNPLLLTLPSGSGSLVELSEDQLTDGPWCGTVNRFDADLYRIRTVGVELRMQVGSADLRGSDPTLFLKPGYAVQGTRMVSDQMISFEVAPRNMNLAR
jgi:hypothetical protein